MSEGGFNGKSSRGGFAGPRRKRGAPEKDTDIIREAQERFDRAKEWEGDARKKFLDDLKFAYADDINRYQWDDALLAGRTGRPSLTINKTRVHCLQVINDTRQNKASINITPVSGEATYQAAQVFEGVVRHIEYISNAAQAYETATFHQVCGGIGYWRVLCDYADEDSFDQEIFIRRVPDPLMIYLDPDIQSYDGSDAKWGMVFYDLERSAFEEQYPNHASTDETPAGMAALNNAEAGAPTDETHVRLVEYYRAGEKSDTLYRFSDGNTERKSRLPDGALEQLASLGIVPVDEREVQETEIEWFLIAGNDKIIDRKPWPGKFVPIVRVPCEEIVVDGKVDRISHTRHLRDPQRLYNWYSSSAAEFVALQSKAPFIGTAEAIGSYKADWENANNSTTAVLLYHGVDPETQAPQQPPQRAQPPVMAQAYMEGLKVAQQEMMMASGQYQAVMGQPSNETSGVAINARQRQGDNATYHVIDHLASAIRFTGRIILDLIPKVYDTPRVLMILGEDGSQTPVHVDPQAPDAHQTVQDPTGPQRQMGPQGQPDPDQAAADAVKTIWNPNVGKYAVVADVGPSYATRREAAFNAFSQIMGQHPDAFNIVGDFWAKNADFPGSDELADRLKRGLPPQYRDGAPDPQVQQLQQQLQQTNQHANQTLQQADAEIAHLKADLARMQEQAKERGGELATRDYQAETERLKAVATADPAAAQVIIRGMLTQLLGMDALPVMHAHQAADTALEQAMAAPQPSMDGGGMDGGGQAM